VLSASPIPLYKIKPAMAIKKSAKQLRQNHLPVIFKKIIAPKKITIAMTEP
jgi:hypothetical protein